VKLLPRRAATPPPDDAVSSSGPAVAGTKGRPTPKRRDSAPRKAPVTGAPRTRKEAYKWQREHSQRAARSGGVPAKAQSTAEFRAALRRGDEAVLPKRDRGPLRHLARDWVDSRRMLSNYLLFLFPAMIVSYVVPFANFVVIVIFFVFLGEWYLSGRKIKALAAERGIEDRTGPFAIGFYAGSRAYLPRRWRMPAPQVVLGDAI
jgi:hypothetical protein